MSNKQKYIYDWKCGGYDEDLDEDAELFPDSKKEKDFEEE